MYSASQRGHLAIVKVLLEAGSNVNQARTSNGGSPLYIASENGNVALVKVLIEAGGNVNQATTDNEATPLFMASFNGHVDIVRLLLQHPNIDTNKKTNRGDSPLYIASKKGNVTLVKGVKKGGGNVNQRLLDGSVRDLSNNRKAKPTIRKQNGHVDIVGLLLRHPNIDANEGYRDTITQFCRTRE